MGIILMFGFLWFGSSRNALAGPAGNHQSQAATETPTFAPGSDELPPAGLDEGVGAALALPTPIAGQTLVYFAITDSDNTATVLYLYNTDTAAHTVALRAYTWNGTLGLSSNITVAASSFLRVSSDGIAAGAPLSWATPAPIIASFSDSNYFASLSLPRGVKVEGYTLYNPTGLVDPRQDQGAVPIRFSTDPATVFLPQLQR